MILSDSEIHKRIIEGSIVILPMPENYQFQGASVDLRLGKHVLIYGCNGATIRSSSPITMTPIHLENKLVLSPNDFMLVQTLESVTLPADLVGRVEGKSSWGRRGLMVHVTAGFIDPGWSGPITLEVKNVNPYRSIEVNVGESITQIAFETISGKVIRPYGSNGLNSHYTGADSVQGPKVTRIA